MPYRAYTDADRAACLAIFDSNADRYFSPGDRAEFEAFLDAPVGFFGVLGDNAGRIVGCGGYRVRDDGQTGVLTWGIVAADCQRRGLGTELTLSRLCKLADCQRVQRVALNTSDQSAGFYLKLGFRLVERVADGYRAGLDRCQMQLDREQLERLKKPLENKSRLRRIIRVGLTNAGRLALCICLGFATGLCLWLAIANGVIAARIEDYPRQDCWAVGAIGGLFLGILWCVFAWIAYPYDSETRGGDSSRFMAADERG
jgi:ribosomal protein S18 acetylase RimI-like enzyme